MHLASNFQYLEDDCVFELKPENILICVVSDGREIHEKTYNNPKTKPNSIFNDRYYLNKICAEKMRDSVQCLIKLYDRRESVVDRRVYAHFFHVLSSKPGLSRTVYLYII